MAKIEIVSSLAKEIKRKFKGESHKIVNLLEALEDNPRKGKALGNIGGVVIKEIRYKSFRFYFITDSFKLRCLDEEHLIDLLIKFVRMSDKKSQQKTIEEIKNILRIIGAGGF
jgi:midasin (ATPase involved in ribosome maturation)